MRRLKTPVEIYSSEIQDYVLYDAEYKNRMIEAGHYDEELYEDGYEDGYALNSPYYWDTVHSDLDVCTEDFINYTFQEIFKEGIFLLTGTCGLWYGKTEAGTICKNTEQLEDALFCHDYDYEIEIKTDGVDVYALIHHHDGTNVFYIRRLKSKGEKLLEETDDWDDRELHQKLSKSKYSSSLGNSYLHHIGIR